MMAIFHLHTKEVSERSATKHTDGSVFDEMAGARVYSEDLKLSLSLNLGRNATIFQPLLCGLRSISKLVRIELGQAS